MCKFMFACSHDASYPLDAHGDLPMLIVTNFYYFPMVIHVSSLLYTNIRPFHRHISAPLFILFKQHKHKCSYCDSVFSRAQNLKIHMQVYHEFDLPSIANNDFVLFLFELKIVN